MKLLLDTCAFVWLVSASDQLGPQARRRLDAHDADLCLSDVSVWELCLKWQAGKLRLPAPPRLWVERQAELWQLERIPLAVEHYYRTTELPDLHRDPFDRLLVAQAIERGMTLVTPDDQVRRYPVATLW